MKLNKSTNKIPDSLKEKMRNIFLNYDVSKNIDKTQIYINKAEEKHGKGKYDYSLLKDIKK